MSSKPTIPEQYTDIFKEVLKSDFSWISSPSYSAVYFTTPEFIAPFAKINTIDMKLLNAPIMATPAGPVSMAIILLLTKPDPILTNVMIDVKKVVFISFKPALNNCSLLQ